MSGRPGGSCRSSGKTAAKQIYASLTSKKPGLRKVLLSGACAIANALCRLLPMAWLFISALFHHVHTDDEVEWGARSITSVNFPMLNEPVRGPVLIYSLMCNRFLQSLEIALAFHQSVWMLKNPVFMRISLYSAKDVKDLPLGPRLHRACKHTHGVWKSANSPK